MFVYDLLPGIQHADKIVGAAFYFEGNDIIIRNYDRADVQVVWGYRGNDKTGRFGKDHGSAAAEGIAGRTGRGGYDQAIGPVGIEELPVQVSMDLDHGGGIGLMDGELVQPVGHIPEQGFVGVEMYQGTFVNDKSAVDQGGDR